MSDPSTPRPPIALDICTPGLVGYEEGLELQNQAALRCLAGGRGTLFLLEHPHVVTLGRNAQKHNVLVPEDELRRRGVELHSCGRGGDVTYHGPGQLVGYPVLLLPEGRRNIHAYVRDIEEALLRTLAEFGIVAARDPGYPGVWIERLKIAALGVRIARWVTTHGFALNVTTDLSFFRLITPCGLDSRGVTSMAVQLGRGPDMVEVQRRVAHHVQEVFGSAPARELMQAQAHGSPIATTERELAL